MIIYTTHKAEEADAVDARAAAAEKTHDGEDEPEDHQGNGHLFDDDDWLGLIVDEERPQRQRLASHVQPYTAHYQRPTADLHHKSTSKLEQTLKPNQRSRKDPRTVPCL